MSGCFGVLGGWNETVSSTGEAAGLENLARHAAPGTETEFYTGGMMNKRGFLTSPFFFLGGETLGFIGEMGALVPPHEQHS